MSSVMQRLILSCVGLAAAALPAFAGDSSIKPAAPRCEYRTNPLGIPAVKPRMSWLVEAVKPDARGLHQTAYRITASSSREKLDKDQGDIWETGRVNGPDTSQIEFAGKPLASRDKVWWKVRVWDENGQESDWSEPCFFSVGLLDESQWSAQWIGLDVEPDAPLTTEVRAELRRIPWIRAAGGPEMKGRTAGFRTEFTVRDDSKVQEAWIAGTADMRSDVRINGTPVGGLFRWELVRPIDVAAAIKAGRNTISIAVTNEDGLNPAVTGMLFIRYADGKTQQVTTDKSWMLNPSIAEGWDGAAADAFSPVEVSGSQPWGGSRNTEHFLAPAPYLRKPFEAAKTVSHATLYATALGLFECSLNGKKIGSDEFAPGWTEYSKRVYHHTYDVTSMIKKGDNVLAAVLADGWYAGLMGYTGQRHYYGGPARFMAQLELEYTDGSRQIVATGPDWKGTFGPIRTADNYLGTTYDSRLEMPGWNTTALAGNDWKPVQVGSGRDARSADVTDKLKALIKDGKLSLKVGPGPLGDPAYGVKKVLTVEYTVGGKADKVSAPENATVSLPPDGAAENLVITHAVFGATPPEPILVQPQPGEPVRRAEEIPAQSVTEVRPGRFIFDLGQNMVGWTRLRIRGEEGQRVTLRHAEVLNPDGTMYTSNLRGALATDHFILKGGDETLEPPFTFHGFRYVEVSGLRSKPSKDMITGVVVHTAMTPVGEFECSNPLVNKLVSNIVWGQKGNYLEVPTDCPQRDERLGWTGDAQFFVNTAAYFFDVSSFMSRWLVTLVHDAQFPDGTFAHVAPKVNEGGGSTAWGDAAIVCTHAIYTTYADTRIVRENFDNMAHYMRWLEGKTKDGISHVGGFGDWLNLGDPTDPDLIDTAYRINLLAQMKEMAGVIGRHDEAAKYAADHEAAMRAFRAKYLGADGALKQSGQTGYALAFTMGLIPESERSQAAEHFVGSIESKDWHLATGFIGTPRLLPALHAAGRDDVAYRLLLNETYPSWLYQVKLGATTMWERWDGWTPERGFSDGGMNSFNHYAFGSVGDYLYRDVAGIAPLAPGYSRILVAPVVQKGIDSAKASYESIAGTIKSSWTRASDGSLSFDITIPANTTAEVRLPAKSADAVREGGKSLDKSTGVKVRDGAGGVVALDVGSGTYRFQVSAMK